MQSFENFLRIVASSLASHDGKQAGYPKNYDLKEIAQLTSSLPFELSDDQKEALMKFC